MLSISVSVQKSPWWMVKKFISTSLSWYSIKWINIKFSDIRKWHMRRYKSSAFYAFDFCEETFSLKLHWQAAGQRIKFLWRIETFFRYTFSNKKKMNNVSQRILFFSILHKINYVNPFAGSSVKCIRKFVKGKCESRRMNLRRNHFWIGNCFLPLVSTCLEILWGSTFFGFTSTKLSFRHVN